MRKEAFNLIKKESLYVGIIFILLLVMFKITFFRSDTMTLLRSAISIFWLFVIPGYFIMFYWKNLEFLERIIAGVMISAGVLGISSYYIGLMGLHIKYHLYIIPAIIIFLSVIMNIFLPKEKSTS